MCLHYMIRNSICSFFVVFFFFGCTFELCVYEWYFPVRFPVQSTANNLTVFYFMFSFVFVFVCQWNKKVLTLRTVTRKWNQSNANYRIRIVTLYWSKVVHILNDCLLAHLRFCYWRFYITTINNEWSIEHGFESCSLQLVYHISLASG